MSEDVHQRAERLLAISKVEGISAAEREWLEAHLEDCARCAKRATAVEQVVASLRSVSIPPDPAVVEAVRRRVRMRAAELHEQQARLRGLWMACALSWALGVLSAPLLWWGLEWIGQRLAMPKPVWFMALVFWWTAPAVAVAGFLIWRKARLERETWYANTEPR